MVRNLKYGDAENQITVEQPIFKGTALTKWIHNGIVVWENGGKNFTIITQNNFSDTNRKKYGLLVVKDGEPYTFEPHYSNATSRAIYPCGKYICTLDKYNKELRVNVTKDLQSWKYIKYTHTDNISYYYPAKNGAVFIVTTENSYDLYYVEILEVGSGNYSFADAICFKSIEDLDAKFWANPQMYTLCDADVEPNENGNNSIWYVNTGADGYVKSTSGVDIDLQYGAYSYMIADDALYYSNILFKYWGTGAIQPHYTAIQLLRLDLNGDVTDVTSDYSWQTYNFNAYWGNMTDGQKEYALKNYPEGVAKAREIGIITEEYGTGSSTPRFNLPRVSASGHETWQTGNNTNRYTSKFTGTYPIYEYDEEQDAFVKTDNEIGVGIDDDVDVLVNSTFVSATANAGKVFVYNDYFIQNNVNNRACYYDTFAYGEYFFYMPYENIPSYVKARKPFCIHYNVTGSASNIGAKPIILGNNAN